jgi:hypothetical protein
MDLHDGYLEMTQNFVETEQEWFDEEDLCDVDV